jgi:hypothetical protein
MLDATDTTTTQTPPPPTGGPPAPRTRPYASMVMGAILVVLGALWLLDTIDVVELRATVILPSVLAVVGLALMVGSFDGPHTGLVVFGVFLTVAVIAVAVTPEGAFRGGIGERRFQVEEGADLASRYDVSMGNLQLDLADLTLDESATVDVTVGAGELRVIIPEDVPVTIDASAGAGKVELLGETTDGISVSRSYTSPGFAEADVTLTLDLDVAAGEIEVTR